MHEDFFELSIDPTGFILILLTRVLGLILKEKKFVHILVHRPFYIEIKEKKRNTKEALLV